MNEEKTYQQEREHMVRYQLQERDIRDPDVLEAFRKVPRHLFVPPEFQRAAYSDGPLPIGEEQTISQPYIQALMVQLLKLDGDERVLEVGAGTGYQAAILAHLAHEVHTMEYHASLAKEAERNLEELGLENVHVHLGDGSKGFPEFAPFQAIVVAAGAPQAPPPLLKQLDVGGRMVIPIGRRGNQTLTRYTRRDGGQFTRESIVPVAFVPLLGEHGWKSR